MDRATGPRDDEDGIHRTTEPLAEIDPNAEGRKKIRTQNLPKAANRNLCGEQCFRLRSAYHSTHHSKDRLDSNCDVLHNSALLVDQVGDGCGEHGVAARDFPLLLQDYREGKSM